MHALSLQNLQPLLCYIELFIFFFLSVSCMDFICIFFILALGLIYKGSEFRLCLYGHLIMLNLVTRLISGILFPGFGYCRLHEKLSMLQIPLLKRIWKFSFTKIDFNPWTSLLVQLQRWCLLLSDIDVGSHWVSGSPGCWQRYFCQCSNSILLYALVSMASLIFLLWNFLLFFNIIGLVDPG